MVSKSSNNVIAKNTTYLYVRMLFTMVVTLYTSRVVLDKLGVDDFGIYQAVGGLVGLITFIQGALSTGASRFITFALGENNFEKLKVTFSTTLLIHFILAITLVALSEIIGPWFINNKMVVPSDRMDAALFAFHLSVIGIVVSLIQVPFNAAVIAHEKMSFYAYTGIFDVCSKLGICYLLSIEGFDKLKIYALLILVIHVLLLLIYFLYCKKSFKECEFSIRFDSAIAKEILGFSGWSLFAHGSLALNSQGVLILLNMFFSPAIVAARAVSTQVYMAATQFVSNFRTAVNPQIVKRLAAGDIQGSHRLLLLSTRYSYYLMLLLCLPLILLTEPILHIWLKEVPEFTILFVKIILVQSLFQVFDSSFYTALYAMGRLRENALLSPTILFIQFPIIYLLFRMGYSPVVLSWANLISVMIIAIVVKPILLVWIAKFSWLEIWEVFRYSIIVTFVSVPLPMLVTYFLDIRSLIGFVTAAGMSVVSVVTSVWFLGLDKEKRILIANYIKK